MLIATIVGVCILLFILALLAPRFSRRPERGAHRAIGAGSRGASKAPGKLGRWLPKPFAKANKAVGTSASEGRTIRSRLPL
jgi:hypothetical protein